LFKEESKAQFIIDAELFSEAMGFLELYEDILKTIYTSIEANPDAVKEELEELEMQIDMIESIISNFRYAVHKTISGTGPDSTFH